MRKKRKMIEEHDNTERWLLTYADMITLLMAFFILMYTISRIDLQKLSEVANALKTQLRGGMFIARIDDVNIVKPHIDSTFVNFNRQIGYATTKSVKNMLTMIRRNKLSRDIRVKLDSRGLVVSLLTDGILFDVKSAELTDSAKKALDIIGPILSSVDNKVLIEGHADEQRFINEKVPSINWHLSAARALSVLEYLVQKNYVEEKRLSLAAYSSFRPVEDPNLTVQERQRLSRRVDIVLLGTPKFLAYPSSTLKELKRDIEVGW